MTKREIRQFVIEPQPYIYKCDLFRKGPIPIYNEGLKREIFCSFSASQLNGSNIL